MEHCPLAYYILNGIIITNPDEYITWFGFGVSWRAIDEQMTTFSSKGCYLCTLGMSNDQAVKVHYGLTVTLGNAQYRAISCLFSIKNSRIYGYAYPNVP